MKEKDQISLTIGWLYPELMSTYGDRGNIFVLRKRCEWRNIDVSVLPVDFQTTEEQLRSCDLIIGGGAQDRQQTIVINDLCLRKGPVLKELFEAGIPGLFVCGSPQLLGHSYMTGDGETLKGLGIFDMESKHFGKHKPRCIGNMLCEISEDYKISYNHASPDGAKDTQHTTWMNTIVGFENHGGRTYLGSKVKPFARVIKGYGNNGEDKTEGAVYNNCIATYSHGPFLSKNPHIADYLLKVALEKKYSQEIELQVLDDMLIWQAHNYMVHRLQS